MPVSLNPPALSDWERPFGVVREQAERHGLRALVVGGYVRDRLLGAERAKKIREVDILVEGQGAIELATAISAALNLHPPVVFERFGTAHLDLDAGHALEFVSSRSERYDPASRKPDVTPGTLKDDVMRRDFTVNTLLMEWDGTVLDLTGRGLSDLKARRIVTPLDPRTTYDEDPLRMLRAVRFATTLGFTLDPSVESAIRDQSGRLQPPTVSMERIRDEFSKLLLADQVQGGLELLDATRLLPRILPQLEAGKGMQQGGWHSHDVFGHALLAASLAPPELITRLAALLHDVGKPKVHELRDGKPTFIGHQEVGATMTGPALRHLRYPGEIVDAVTKLVRLHMRPIQYDPQGWEDKAVRRLVRDAGDQLDRLLALARVVPEFTVSPTLVLAVFLPPLLFDAGFSMRAAAVRRELPWILLLGLAGAVLTAAVSFGLLLAAGVPFDEGIVLAAILAATDPVSVFAALRRLHTPERLRVALEGESLANDGVAVLLFVVALAVVERRVIDAPGVLGLVFSQAAGGLVIGIGIGLLTRRILAVTAARADLWPWSWRLAMIWAGLRGALSLALALGVPAAVARHDEILVLVFGFVFLSLVVQGLSTGPVFKALGITRQTAVTTVL